MKKNDGSEKELVLSVQKGNTLDFAILLDKYAKYSHVLANSYYASINTGGVTRQELYAVCLEALVLALKNFKPKDHYFYPYWREIAQRKMLRYLEENSYLMGARVFAGLSLDSISEFDNAPFANALGEEDGTIYGNITYKEMSEELYKSGDITSFQHKVLNLLLLGFDVDLIARKLKCSKSRVYSCRNSLKSKLIQKYGLHKQ